MNAHQRRIEKRRAERFAASPEGKAIIKAIDKFTEHCRSIRGITQLLRNAHGKQLFPQ